jgi:hypothetical protein
MTLDLKHHVLQRGQEMSLWYSRAQLSSVSQWWCDIGIVWDSGDYMSSHHWELADR